MFGSSIARMCSASLCLAAPLAANTAYGTPLHPDSVEVFTLDGSSSPGTPFRDDVYLGALVFGGLNYAYGEQIVAISEFEVLSGRPNINAEWGDLDDASDGDPNPFVKAGYDPALQETTDPIVQDATLKSAFNSGSLSEMSDGEGGDAFWFRASFTQSLTDNQYGTDDRPELVVFERGLNDRFDIRLITGGSFEAPLLSDWLEVDSRQFARSGVYVDTVEIGGAQEIGVGGFDLDQFNLDAGAKVYGLEIRAEGRAGPDLNGMFLTADDASRFEAPLSPVPLQASAMLSGLSAFAMLGSLVLMRQRRAGTSARGQRNIARPIATLGPVPDEK